MIDLAGRGIGLDDNLQIEVKVERRSNNDQYDEDIQKDDMDGFGMIALNSFSVFVVMWLKLIDSSLVGWIALGPATAI